MCYRNPTDKEFGESLSVPPMGGAFQERRRDIVSKTVERESAEETAEKGPKRQRFLCSFRDKTFTVSF